MFEQYTKQLKKRLPKIYREYLLKFADEKQINQMFANEEVAMAFNNVVDLFYKNSQFGNQYNDEIKNALKTYEAVMQEEVGFKDEYLRQFLHIYRFYAETMQRAVNDQDGKYQWRKEKSFFERFSYVCCQACENLFTDLQNGYRWWEIDCATTLRRQFMNNRVVLPDSRIQKMCREYLGREIDIEKELHLSEHKTEPPMELVKELDEKMAKRGYRLAYAYVKEVDGKFKVVESNEKPTDGRYYLRRYVDKDKTLQK